MIKTNLHLSSNISLYVSNGSWIFDTFSHVQPLVLTIAIETWMVIKATLSREHKGSILTRSLQGRLPLNEKTETGTEFSCEWVNKNKAMLLSYVRYLNALYGYVYIYPVPCKWKSLSATFKENIWSIKGIHEKSTQELQQLFHSHICEQ